MVNKKTYFLTLSLAALTLAGAAGVKSVKAVDNFAKEPDSVIQQLVKKFNLNQEEVDQTIAEVRQERQEQRQAEWENSLGKAVNDGVITENQKQALLNKHQEMQARRSQEREEMQKWMSDNNLDFEKLSQYGIGIGFGRKRGGFGGTSCFGR